MRGIRLYAIVAAAFVAGAFLASPELRAYAANTVGSADIINNSIQSVDIKDNEVKAADIAANAVGASEIIGVSKLVFRECTHSADANTSYAPGFGPIFFCNVPGSVGDSVIATNNGSVGCFAITQGRFVASNSAVIVLTNNCSFNLAPGTVKVSVIAFDM